LCSCDILEGTTRVVSVATGRSQGLEKDDHQSESKTGRFIYILWTYDIDRRLLMLPSLFHCFIEACDCEGMDVALYELWALEKGTQPSKLLLMLGC